MTYFKNSIKPALFAAVALFAIACGGEVDKDFDESHLVVRAELTPKFEPKLDRNERETKPRYTAKEKFIARQRILRATVSLRSCQDRRLDVVTHDGQRMNVDLPVGRSCRHLQRYDEVVVFGTQYSPRSFRNAKVKKIGVAEDVIMGAIVNRRRSSGDPLEVRVIGGPNEGEVYEVFFASGHGLNPRDQYRYVFVRGSVNHYERVVHEGRLTPYSVLLRNQR